MGDSELEGAYQVHFRVNALEFLLRLLCIIYLTHVTTKNSPVLIFTVRDGGHSLFVLLE